jgi:hypothetical protein
MLRVLQHITYFYDFCLVSSLRSASSWRLYKIDSAISNFSLCVVYEFVSEPCFLMLVSIGRWCYCLLDDLAEIQCSFCI